MLDKEQEIQVEPSEALDCARYCLDSNHFRNILKQLDTKYSSALKNGDPINDLYYNSYAHRYQGIREFVTLLIQPVRTAEEKDNNDLS